MAHEYDAIPKKLKTDMSIVVYSFSPENLSCDGELSHSEVESKINMLSREWAVLVGKVVKACGVTVDFDEFEEYMY